MDFMKVFDQTVREIKREVNLKVLKVPEIEQKVLDATDNEPWGPHGSVLAEIAQATKKFSECQIVMSVLWTRLAETGRDWRYVYKALAVIEYLVANGSERAVDDIIEHTFKIASLSAFEYTEPSGKDVGINVRKKAETIVGILNNKDKIQEIRNKASANRDKYFGLSSSGVTYKSGSASFSSAGLRATREGDTFRDSYKDQDQFGEEKTGRGTSANSYRGSTSENNVTSRKGSNQYGSADHDSLPSSSKALPKIIDSDKYGSKPSQKSAVPSNKYEDDSDDFDPRGASSTKPATESFNQVDLFGRSLVDDLMDTPTPVPSETSTMNSNSADVDLFADATFVSASPGVKSGRNSQILMEDDLFASQPTFPSAPSAAAPSATPVDFFAVPGPAMQSETKSPKSSQISESTFDPFAAVPLNSLDGSDIFGSFTSHADSTSAETRQNPIDSGDPNYSKAKSTDSRTSNKTDGFQVKSGIWADTLSRGLIDLNIAAPKKVSLADIGVVGGLSDGFDERGKGPAPVTYNMGRAMGAGTGLGMSGIAPATGGDDIFSNLSSQQDLFGSFKR